MSNKKSSSNFGLGCFLMIVCMGVSLILCKPIVNILGDGAYPIVVFGGLLLAKFLEGFFKEGLFEEEKKEDNLSPNKISLTSNKKGYEDDDDYNDDYDDEDDDDYYNFEIEEEEAQRLIESTPILEKAGILYKNIEISRIKFTDTDEEPFMDEDTNELFAITIFKAFSTSTYEKAVEAFTEGDYNRIKHKYLAMRMTVEEAHRLSPKMIGTLELQTIIDEDGDEYIIPKTFTPNA